MKLRKKDGAYGMGVYKCTFCKGFHVGRTPDRIKKFAELRKNGL